MNSETFSSILGIYQKARGRGEDTKLTLETKDNVETVSFSASMAVNTQTAWSCEREGQNMPASPLYSIPPPNMWRSPVPGPPGRIWTPPTPPTSVKKKSPSCYKRSSERSKLWKDSLEITKLNHSSSVDSESDRNMPDNCLETKEPELLKKTETLDAVKMAETVHTYHVETKPGTVDTTESKEEPKVISDSAVNNLKDKPSQTLNWTNPEYDTSYMDPPPSKKECGGISVGKQIAIMHRPECWSGDVTCDNWPGDDYEVMRQFMHYSEFDKMLHIDYTPYIISKDGEPPTFDWKDFIEDAKELKIELDLNHIPYTV